MCLFSVNVAVYSKLCCENLTPAQPWHCMVLWSCKIYHKFIIITKWLNAICILLVLTNYLTLPWSYLVAQKKCSKCHGQTAGMPGELSHHVISFRHQTYSTQKINSQKCIWGQRELTRQNKKLVGTPSFKMERGLSTKPSLCLYHLWWNMLFNTA